MADNFESTIRMIMERTGMGRDDVMTRIWRKYQELDVLSIEGAASMVGKELGVNLSGG